MLKIMPYNYNSNCDTNMCSNMAQVSIGVPGEPMDTYHNLCGRCLQELVAALPINLILSRHEIRDKIAESAQKQAQDMIFSFSEGVEGDTVSETPEDTISAPKAVFDYDLLSMRELKAIAKVRGLSGYANVNKSELVTMLEDPR